MSYKRPAMDKTEFQRTTKMLIGLEAQGHIQTIESMLADHKSWDQINSAIGWVGDAANKDYIRYLQRKNEALQKELEEMYSKIEEAFRAGWSKSNTQYNAWTLETEVKEYMQALKQKEE